MTPSLLRSIAFCATVIIMFSSCGPSKKAHEARIYLMGVDSMRNNTYRVPEPIIQINDLLSIRVYSDNPEATALFNQAATGSGAGSGGNAGSASAPGYQVDVQGNIHFQSLGAVHVAGLTKMELTTTLQEQLKKFLTNPYVEVGFLNTRITVMGEVSKPGIISIPEQKLTIMDALALSGDLTVYGRRDNILVIRERNGKRETARLNIHNPSIMQSEYYYLQQNDMVYVEPIRKKPTGTDQNLLRNITIGTTIVSTLVILFSIFRK